MARNLTLAPPDVCLKVYYEASCGEVGNKEIREIFQNQISGKKIASIKREVLEIMASEGIRRFHDFNVNVDILFRVLGLDVKRLERNRRKLMDMGLSQ